MTKVTYQREKAVEYAKKWAFLRNPNYYNFDSVGGDCTSFISQCIYAGSGIMNYSKQNGWYYINGYNKSPSWSGVKFLYQFLTTNKGIGPFGKLSSKEEIEIGDIAQLSFDGINFAHSLIITSINNNFDLDNIKIASHTLDNFNKPISSYNFQDIRFVHIEGIRK